MKKLYITAISLLISSLAFSQIGGLHTYEFLNLVSSPRVAAMGGKYVSYVDNDLALVYFNPSLLNADMQQSLTLNYVNYFTDLKYGYVSYAWQTPRKNMIAAGIQYMNYGTFIGADENGTITSSFGAADYAFNLAFSHNIDSFLTVGADVRPIVSVIENYQSIGLSTDLGITWHRPDQGQTVALVLRNLGTQIKPYYETRYESIPLEVQAGFTQKLKYAPFRLSVTAQHLETPDMSVTDFEQKQKEANSVNATAAKTKRQYEVIGDQIMRHLIFGVEFTPIKNFYLRAGYNYQRRQELKVSETPGMVGFSWGVGLSIMRFQLSYGRARYNLAAATNHFSIATDLRQFYHRTKSK